MRPIEKPGSPAPDRSGERARARVPLAAVMAAAVMAVSAHAAGPAVTYEVIHKFNGEEGFVPAGALAAGADGAMYGTTAFGAAYSHGASFRIQPDGRLRTLHVFAEPGAPLVRPSGGLTLAADGHFYGGATEDGSGHGLVYRMTAKGNTTTLLDLNTTACAHPAGQLAQAADGKLYGVTTAGGTEGRGCIYRLGTDGSFTLLRSLSVADGLPQDSTRLLAASDGYLYGTAPYGGDEDGGTLYRIDPSTGEFMRLHSFAAPAVDGPPAQPTSGLVEAPDGMLYGTTGRGGARDLGVVYRIAKDGSELLAIDEFALHGKDQGASGELVLGSDGLLYGSSYKGGIRGQGNYFSETLAGGYTRLHHTIRELKESSALVGQMLELSPGEFYGVTATGGKYTQGTVFRMRVSAARPR